MEHQHVGQVAEVTLSKKLKSKKENPDLLELCNLVPLEVINLGGKGYDPQHSNDYSTFKRWLQCYYVPGMKTLRDSNSRTIWFQGDPGPLAPKGEKKNRKQMPLVKADPDPSQSSISKRKRKLQGSVMKESAVSPNKDTPKKVIHKKERESRKLSISLSQKRKGSVQDLNTPKARQRNQRATRLSKIVTLNKDAPKTTPLVKRKRGQKTSMKEDPASPLKDVSRNLQQENGLTQQLKCDEESSSVIKTTPENSDSLSRMQQSKKEEPAQIAEDSLQDFQMPQSGTQLKKEEEPMQIMKDTPKHSKVLAKVRTQQWKSTRASPQVVGGVTQNSQFVKTKPLEQKEEEHSLIPKDLSNDPFPLKGRKRQLKNKEDTSTITGDCLRNIPLIKDKKLKTTEEKRAGDLSDLAASYAVERTLFAQDFPVEFAGTPDEQKRIKKQCFLPLLIYGMLLKKTFAEYEVQFLL